MTQSEEIIIYQAGKVGSSSIAFALERAGFRVAHVHVLNKIRLDAFVSDLTARGEKTPPSVSEAFRIRKEYLDTGKRLKVVCAVRDPVARNLSAFFENIDVFCPGWRQLKGRDASAITEQFIQSYPHHVATEWIDYEFRRVLGIDVYANPFSHAEGVGRYRSDMADALILRAEDDNKKKQKALSDFLECDAIKLRNENRGVLRPWGDLYKNVKKQIVFPQEYLDEMYNSEMAKYFYTDEERAAFRKKAAGSVAQQEAM